MEFVVFPQICRYVIALARDLRDEFYAYLIKGEKPVLEIIIKLLQTKEPDQLEWTLICLAHLFKILKPYLKKDFAVIFDSLLPLLDAENADHITNFAVECFAFVARDIIDKEKFLTAILSKLSAKIANEECSEYSTRGSGQLLFEVIRGVNGQFHSCAEAYLHVYFDLLSKLPPHKSDLLCDILGNMISVLVQCITPANMQLYWDACYHTLAQFRIKADKGNFNGATCKKFILLMGQTVETRDGKFLTNPSQFVKEAIKAIDLCENDDECLNCITELVTVLLLAKNVALTQLDASLITKKVLKTSSTEVFESFVWNCTKYSQFEILILPEFLRYASKQFGLSVLELMAKIILEKAPLCGDGITINNRNYSIRMSSEKCLKRIQQILSEADDCEELFTNPREFLLALIIYPHIVGVEISPVLKNVNGKIELCLKALKSHDGEMLTEADILRIQMENQRIIFILSLLVETQIHLRQLLAKSTEKVAKADLVSLKIMVEKLLPFSSCENYRYIHALRILDLIITFESSKPKGTESSEFNVDLFRMIHCEISNNLASRYHTIRRTTAHLFSQFSNELKINGTEFAIYNVFFNIESIETTIHSYREQLLLLQRIEPSAKFMSSLSEIDDAIKFDPLKFLLGFLHVNFNLLWKPITELITTYFSELNIEDFWSLYKAKIDETTALQRRKQLYDICEDNEFIDVTTCLGDEYTKIQQNNERSIDLVNYRILLWRAIPSLGMLREIKNREIVTIFLDFIEHEYKRTIDRDTLTLQAQRKRKTKKSARGKAFSECENDDNDDEDEGGEHVIDDQNVPAGTQRTLTTMLQVFVNQNNPKQLHREPELWNLYMDLLSHRNAAVQKMALECVAAYKHKYLQPYMEHLHNLVDETKFKGAIVHFKIDKENGLVQPEHRQNLMPIVMRILFSKMLTRVGGQKTSNQTRKSLVMRFLGGCHEDEILLMFHMSFWMFESEFKEDAREMCLNVSGFNGF